MTAAGERRLINAIKPRLSLLGLLLVLALVWFLSAKGSHVIVSSPAGKDGNRPPAVTMVELVPPLPDLQSVVKAEIRAEDPDHDPLTYRYRWMINQREVSDQAILPLQGFRQGDLVSVEVTPSDGSVAGAPVRSHPVAIVNNPPVVKTITLSPADLKAGQAVQATVDGLDKEGDTIGYAYAWQVNGRLIEEQAGPLLDGAHVHSADRIAVIVTPNDPFSAGTPRASPLITVMNRSPEITSLPPAGIDNGAYVYQVVAHDPDGDPLSYQLIEGPSGTVLDGAGLLRWKGSTPSQDSARVTIQVDDSKGGKSLQRFVIQTK